MEIEEFKDKMKSLGAWDKFIKEFMKSYQIDYKIEEFLKSDIIGDTPISCAFVWEDTCDGDYYWLEIESKFKALLK